MSDKTTNKTPDETPKKAIAKKVVTAKRQYFFPSHGVSIEAESTEQAESAFKKLNKKKVGDG